MASYSARERRRIDDIKQELGTVVDGGAPALKGLVKALKDLLETERALAFVPEVGATSTSLAALHYTGFPNPTQRLERDLDAWMSSAKGGRWALYTPQHAEPFQRNQAFAVGSYQELLTGKGADIDVAMLDLDDEERATLLHNLESGHHFFASQGVLSHQQLRVLVCDGPRLLAWVGGMQPEPFSPRQRRLLAALVPSLQRRLLTEELLAQGPALRAALDVALEEIPRPACLVTKSGRVAHANAAARVILDEEPRALQHDLAASLRDPAGRFRVTPVHIEGAPELFMLVEREAPRDPRLIAARARARYGLTERQTQVVAELLRGRANRAIAAALGCTERTVEVHVAEVLRKTGVESRAAFIAALWMDG